MRLTPVIGYCLTQISKSVPQHAAGLTDAELELVRGDKPWEISDRSAMVRALDCCMVGGLERCGLPQVDVPAEYVAALIATVVHPVNALVACHWLGQRYSVRSEASGIQDGVGRADQHVHERIGPRQLFAMVLLAQGSDPAFKERFESELQSILEQ